MATPPELRRGQLWHIFFLMSGVYAPNELLTNCFVQRYGDRAGMELHSFLTNLAAVKLPFDLNAQMRCWTHPAFIYPDERRVWRKYPGLPPKYYYFVPGSNYGGHNEFPADPLALSFVASVDGFGFNFGCPLRLHAALKVFSGLPENDRQEAIDGLAVATKHIATVEELFAAGIWDNPVSVRRPPATARKSHDWNVTFADGGFHQECKYLPALWPQMDEDFELRPGAFAAKAAKQLPEIPSPGCLNVLAVIGVCPMNDSLRAYCTRELRDHPVMDVLVYMSTVGDTYVFSTSGANARHVQSRITRIAADDFGPFSIFAFFRPERQRRQAARQGAAPADVSPEPAHVVELTVETLPPRRELPFPPPAAFPYRCVERRKPDGEPEFTFVPPARTERPFLTRRLRFSCGAMTPRKLSPFKDIPAYAPPPVVLRNLYHL